MKSKFFKTLTSILAVMMIFASFSGCGEKKTETVTNGSEVKLNGEKIYPIECEDTLDFWFTGTNEWTNQYENFGETPLAKAISEKTGVKINYIHPQAGQSKEQFQLLLASDELPDIVNHTWFTYPGGPDAAIKDGYIYALNDIIDQYAPALKKVLEDNENWSKQVKTDNGDYFVFPQFNKGGILRVAYGPVVRGDWMDKLNLKNPTTIDEWENVLTAFKGIDTVTAPMIADIGSLQNGFMPAFGIALGWYKDGDEIKYGQAQPKYREFLQKMNEWYNKGLFDKDFAVVKSDTVQKAMLNHQAGATLAWAGSGVGGWIEAMEGEQFDIRGVQFPSMGDGGNAEYGYLMSDVGTSNVTAISTRCKNVELAARFLDWGFTEEGYEVYNFGVEGESFNYVNDYPQMTDLILNNPDGLNVANMFALYTRSSHCNVPMVQAVEYIEQYYKHQAQKDAQVEWAKQNMDAHLIPQLYVKAEQTDRDADIMANVKTYVDEMTIKFIDGRESLDNFDKYLEQLKSFGLDESIAFRQEAYERAMKR